MHALLVSGAKRDASNMMTDFAASQIPEIASIVCDYAVPSKPWHGHHYERFYDIYRPTIEDLASFGSVCGTWWRIVQARVASVDSFYIAPPHMTQKTEGLRYPSLFDSISGGTLGRGQVRSLLLIPGDHLEQDDPDFGRFPTITWIKQQDWALQNLSSLSIDFGFRGHDDDDISVVQQLLARVPLLHTLRIEGCGPLDPEDGLDPKLDLSDLFQRACLREVWISDFAIAVRGPAAAMLSNLVLNGCRMTQQEFANMLHSSSKSLQSIHLQGILGADLSWAGIKLALKHTPESLRSLFIVYHWTGKGILENINGNLSDDEWVLSCKHLEVLHLPDFTDPANLAEHWPNLKIVITDDNDPKTFIKEALRTTSPTISYIAHQHVCDDCYREEHFEEHPPCDWLPSRVGALYLCCKECDSGPGKIPWSEAIFYDRPFSVDMMPSNYVS